MEKNKRCRRFRGQVLAAISKKNLKPCARTGTRNMMSRDKELKNSSNLIESWPCFNPKQCH